MKNRSLRVFLADDNKDFCDIIARYLQKQQDIEVVETAHNGIEALEKIMITKPDIAILDGAMPELDGLGILEKLKNVEDRPICIMLSGICNENVTNRAYELGAEYYIVKPFELEVLANRIRMFQGAVSSSKNNDENTRKTIKDPSLSLEERVTGILQEIGIPVHILGYQYMRTAIMIAVNNFDVVNHITKELYPEIAKRCNTVSSRVERAIRHAIEITWLRRANAATDSLYGYTVNLNKWKPTNSEFIAIIADRLRLEFKVS